MATIIRRPQGQGQDVATATSTWDPFRLMREMLRWEGEPVLADFHAFSPTFDVKETKDSYVFRADLPGVKDKDLDVQLIGNRLTIAGHREEEKREQGETYYATERSYGSFSRSFTLPEGTDAERVAADLKDGVLQVVVPKKPEVRPKKIEIGRGGEVVKDTAKA
jgi:HSP20 family protein